MTEFVALTDDNDVNQLLAILSEQIVMDTPNELWIRQSDCIHGCLADQAAGIVPAVTS